MVDAHQGLDDGLLQDLGVVVVADVEDPLYGEQDDVHDSFQLVLADLSALQEELPEAHEDVELELP